MVGLSAERNVVELVWPEGLRGLCDVGCYPRVGLSLGLKLLAGPDYVADLWPHAGDQ